MSRISAVAVEHAPLGELLEVALLAGRERMIDQDDIGSLGLRRQRDFVRLAAAHEEARVGPLATAGDGGDGLRARGSGELREFLQVFGIDGCAQPQAHEHGALTAAWALEHS